MFRTITKFIKAILCFILVIGFVLCIGFMIGTSTGAAQENSSDSELIEEYSDSSWSDIEHNKLDLETKDNGSLLVDVHKNDRFDSYSTPKLSNSHGEYTVFVEYENTVPSLSDSDIVTYLYDEYDMSYKTSHLESPTEVDEGLYKYTVSNNDYGTDEYSDIEFVFHLRNEDYDTDVYVDSIAVYGGDVSLDERQEDIVTSDNPNESNPTEPVETTEDIEQDSTNLSDGDVSFDIYQNSLFKIFRV